MEKRNPAEQITHALQSYKGTVFRSFPLLVNESKWKYAKAAAILSGKNVQWVVEIAFIVA